MLSMLVQMTSLKSNSKLCNFIPREKWSKLYKTFYQVFSPQYGQKFKHWKHGLNKSRKVGTIFMDLYILLDSLLLAKLNAYMIFLSMRQNLFKDI